MKRGSKGGAKAGAPDASGEGFDEVLGKLRAVVEQLETDDLSLEAALTAYESGVGLARQGHGLLDRAEQRVELLMAGDETPRTMPGTEPEPDDDSDDDDDEDDDA